MKAGGKDFFFAFFLLAILGIMQRIKKVDEMRERFVQFIIEVKSLFFAARGSCRTNQINQSTPSTPEQREYNDFWSNLFGIIPIVLARNSKIRGGTSALRCIDVMHKSECLSLYGEQFDLQTKLLSADVESSTICSTQEIGIGICVCLFLFTISLYNNIMCMCC